MKDFLSLHYLPIWGVLSHKFTLVAGAQSLLEVFEGITEQWFES